MDIEKQVLTETECAKYVALSLTTLRRGWRGLVSCPPDVRLTDTRVGYLKADCDAWLASMRVAREIL